MVPDGPRGPRIPVLGRVSGAALRVAGAPCYVLPDMHRATSVLSFALLLAAGCVCQTDASIAAGGGKGVGKAPAKADPEADAKPDVKAETKADAPAPDSKVADAKADVPVSQPLPGDAEDPRGNRFADPSWFRKDLIEGATAKDVSRTERNEKGLFSSQILFELPSGTTAEQCADKIEAKVKPDVANLVRTPDEKMPDRLRLTGDTPRYKVTIICGVAAGATRAYVGYEWLE